MKKEKEKDKNQDMNAAAAQQEAQQQAAQAAEEQAAEEQAAQTDQEETPVDDAAVKLEEQLNTVRDQYIRMAAEYDNFRKRSVRERDNIYSDATIATCKAFLPVLDNLERAANQETVDEAYKKGVEMTLKQFYDCLDKLNIHEIPALGQQFNPELHNAVMHIEDDTCDDNTVVEVFEKGFEMNGKVVRYATVKVAN